MKNFAVLFVIIICASSCGGSSSSSTPAPPDTVKIAVDSLIISEIMYHPKGETEIDGDLFEYIELLNMGTSDLDVSGYKFKGIDYTFTQGSTIASGEFFIIARDRDSFYNRYDFYPDAVYAINPDYDPAIDEADDIYKQLANSGEKISIKNSESTTIFSVEYNDKGQWQRGPDGFGYSLVLIDAQVDCDAPSNWRASANINGSPGLADPAVAYQMGIVINEVFTHTDGDDQDSIELYNTTGSSIDISGWFLADDNGKPDVLEPSNMKMYKIPENTIIEANGFWACNENDFNTNNNLIPFALSEQGDSVFLYSADQNENFTGFMLCQRFGATDTGQAIGRYQTSTGVDFTILETVTIGSENGQPFVGAVVINEIMYNPNAGNTVEFIELYNNQTWSVDLSGWKLEGINFDFPQDTQIAANSYLLIIDGGEQAVDYTNEINDFRNKNSISDSIPILATSMVLKNEGESLILKKPNGEELEELIEYITVDHVTYNDKSPWPEAADGTGVSLERISPSAYGNDPVNWQASVEDGGRPGQ